MKRNMCLEMAVGRGLRPRKGPWLSLLAIAATLISGVPMAHATFPGSNGRIAFGSERDGDFEIYTMNPDGSDVVQLTANASLQDRYPAWSPDGTMLAFSSDRDGDEEIFVMCADGTGQTQLTFNTFRDFEPTWSPDGTKLTFVSDRDGDAEIYVMNANGTEQTQRTFNTVLDFLPAWSPDGTKIAFVSGADHAGEEIWWMNANGTEQIPLTVNGLQDTEPRWKPDGSLLLFRREYAFGSGWAELLTMNPQVGVASEANITHTSTIYEGEGVFSPNGALWAFNSTRSGNFEIYIGSTNITNSPGQDSDLDWQATPTIVPREVSQEGATVPFSVSKSAQDQIDLTWEAACATSYRIVAGSLGALQTSGVTAANSSPMVCGISGTSTTQPMPLDSVFLLVVGENGAGTGPLGNASSGVPRTASPSCP